MGSTRRSILAVGAAAAAQRAFAQQPVKTGTGKFYERGPVRIAYQEAGSGFPLLLIAGGGLNSRMSLLPGMPFDPVAEFKHAIIVRDDDHGAISLHSYVAQQFHDRVARLGVQR